MLPTPPDILSSAPTTHPRPSSRGNYQVFPLQLLLLKSLATAHIWVLPELIGHSAVTMLMLISMHWFILLLNLPIVAWNFYRYLSVPSGNVGVFDPTEIHNRGLLKTHMKEAMIKLGFHLLCFFIYLYSMILALIND
ncbi:protein cornichon homolog 4 isoform X2 [Hemitrygon akajei]|uniref:protein cornichon homolog 4 isoform X2 n=1 Tax=Hemitrygon akajei TaxID=2704970 RepID=UPI003BF97AC1